MKTNENNEVIWFCDIIKKRIWPRRDLLVPYLFWHQHLVKEVCLPEHTTAVHTGVFSKLTALEDLYLSNGKVTLFEGCLPDHKVTIHVPFNEDCQTALMEYDWNADTLSGACQCAGAAARRQDFVKQNNTLENSD